MICFHQDCTLDAAHTIADGTELCDLHLAVLRALHERKKVILDPDLAGDPDSDLEPVDAAIAELEAQFVAPEGDAE